MDLTAFDLKGKVALVTGGAHGIGFSIAEGMAKCGATVCFNCSNEGSLEKGLAAYKAAGTVSLNGINRHPYCTTWYVPLPIRGRVPSAMLAIRNSPCGRRVFILMPAKHSRGA